jgi:prepilin-type N-terminal cleavage/methylation domain-containing protein
MRSRKTYYIGKRRRRSGFTIIETLIAMSITALSMLAILTTLQMTRLSNSLEQERSRAHQIVSEEMEKVRFSLYTLVTAGTEVTVWDNGTPDDMTDDTQGTLEIVITDPETGATLAAAPNPAKRVQVEVTLSWNPRGRLGGSKTMRETVMTYISP